MERTVRSIADIPEAEIRDIGRAALDELRRILADKQARRDRQQRRAEEEREA